MKGLRLAINSGCIVSSLSSLVANDHELSTQIMALPSSKLRNGYESYESMSVSKVF